MYFRRYIEVLLVLLSGLIVYRICRPGMLLFQWFGVDHPAGNVSGVFRLLNNYYGDLAWVVALCMTTHFMEERNFAGPGSVLLLLSLPFLTELLQLVHLVPGVFDWFDMIIYLTVICCFRISFQKHFLIWKK
jgi:hypothetical protein